MTLDLDEITAGWTTPPGELRARRGVGRDGGEVIQIRIELGLLQVVPAGRPDGQTYRGFDSARAYVEHELRLERDAIERRDLNELDREVQQYNYRRLAYGHLAEDALRSNQSDVARADVAAALRDIEECQARLRLLDRLGGAPPEASTLRPTLAFDQARLLTQFELVRGEFEAAVEQAEAGAVGLETILRELGFDEEFVGGDNGVAYLRELARKLRTEYGIVQTLRERLAEAIENEDFEAAAELRDALKKRGG